MAVVVNPYSAIPPTNRGPEVPNSQRGTAVVITQHQYLTDPRNQLEVRAPFQKHIRIKHFRKEALWVVRYFGDTDGHLKLQNQASQIWPARGISLAFN
jgi:hypothetical protein